MSSKVLFEKVATFGAYLSSFATCANTCEGDKIASCHTRKRYEITDIGIMNPEEAPTLGLNPGQVGYIACGMKQSSEGVCLAMLLYLASRP